MNEREDKNKRSLSETAPPVETSSEQKRINSQSVAKIGDTKQEDLEEQTLLERVLERQPKGESEWQMTPFEQKRNIAGFKTRLSWTLHPREVHSVLKFSFANRFFNQMGNIFEGDLIVELEEVNFELPLAEKQKLQEKVEEILNDNLERIRTKGFGEEWRRQNEYLRGILTELSVSRGLFRRNSGRLQRVGRSAA